MELIRNKRIGKILFIVEGSKHEFSLIKRIFGDILGYKRIEKRRNKATYYESQTDSHRVVAVITNAAVYYVFDRDSESNTDFHLILDLLRTLKNSRENEDNVMGGVLVLSYPSIEAYEISNFVDCSYDICAKLGADVKEYINQNAKHIAMNKINEKSIIHACIELKQYMKEQQIEFDIDDFSFANIEVFDREENHFKEKETYFLLSMMSYILLDLGILQE